MRLARHRHYGTGIVITYLVISIVVTPLPLPKAVQLVVYGGLFLVLVYGQVAALRHQFGHLCEKCMADMPLNPQEKAEKVKPLLRTAHALHFGTKRVVMTSVATLGLAVAAVVLASTIGGGPLFVVTSEALLLLLLASHVSMNAHRKYAPWCPYCNGGGGDYVRGGSPDPSVIQPV